MKKRPQLSMSAETSNSTIKSKQSTWVSDYLLNAAENSYDGFGVDDEVRIKIFDDKEEGIYNRTLGKIYGRRT